jgi:hypothetical protein
MEAVSFLCIWVGVRKGNLRLRIGFCVGLKENSFNYYESMPGFDAYGLTWSLI